MHRDLIPELITSIINRHSRLQREFYCFFGTGFPVTQLSFNRQMLLAQLLDRNFYWCMITAVHELKIFLEVSLISIMECRVRHHI